MIDAKRQQTMMERLGEAAELIDDKRFLPMFRNRQIHYPEEFKRSIEIARKKKNPSHYFANIWSTKNLKRTLNIITKMINLAKNAIISAKHAIKSRKMEKEAQEQLEQPMNREARRRYERTLRKLSLKM